MNTAAIDIGSNSVLLVVASPDGRVLHDEARVVALGRGLGDRGLFAPDRMAATEAALGDYVQVAASFGVPASEIRAAATSASRRAMNAETFYGRLRDRLGLTVRVVSGDEEARLTWLGALRDLPVPDGPVLVVDLGGGSTELVLGARREILRRRSLELGSVRLTEQFFGSTAYDLPPPGAVARIRSHVDLEFTRFAFDPPPRTVVGVAGTVTTLAAMALGLDAYDRDRVHGSRLSRAQLSGFVDRLLVAGPVERRALAAVSPERADTLLAGALVLERVLAASRRASMVVSDRGLRFGLLV